jgi:hypothetical protein
VNELPHSLVLILPLLVLGIVLFLQFRNRQRNAEILSQVSLRRGGTVKGGFFLSLPTLVFPYKSQDITVHSTPGSDKSPPRTKISTALLELGRDFKMHIYKEHFLLKALKLVGVQDIQVGNDAFDNAFMVQGSDESSVKALLTPVIQEKLLGLSAKGLSLTLNQNELKLVVNLMPSSEYEYDPLLDAFTAVLDGVRSGNY